MTYHPVTMVTKSQAIIFWNIGKYISLTIKSSLLFFCIIWTHFCLLKNTKVQISQILRIEIPNVGCAKRRIVSRSRSFGSSRNAPPFFGAGLVGAGGRLRWETMMWRRGVWECFQGIYRGPNTQRKSTRNHYCVTWDSCFFSRRLLWKLAAENQLSTTFADYVNASLVVIYLGFAGYFARVKQTVAHFCSCRWSLLPDKIHCISWFWEAISVSRFRSSSVHSVMSSIRILGGTVAVSCGLYALHRFRDNRQQVSETSLSLEPLAFSNNCTFWTTFCFVHVLD